MSFNLTIPDLAILRESEDCVEFKEAQHNFPWNGGSHREQKDRRKCYLGYIVALANEGGGLLVSNHRSYLDPVVLLRDILAVAVAKKEVQDWPIIGYGARISGAIFVDRSNKESRRETREAIGEAIRDGYFIDKNAGK